MRLFVLSVLAVAVGVASAQDYVPPRGEWERRAPQAVGLDAGRLAEAVAFA